MAARLALRRPDAALAVTERATRQHEAGGPAGFEHVLALQRAAGNHAVTALLRQSETSTGAAIPGARVVDVAELDRLLQQYLTAEDWAGMSAILLRYRTDRERSERLEALDLWQVMRLVGHLRPGGEPSPRPGPLLQLAERAQKPKLDLAYAEAIDTPSWRGTVWLLRGYDSLELMLKAREFQQRNGPAAVAQCAGIARSMYGDSHRVARVLAFLPLEAETGAAARPGRSTTMNLPSKGTGPAVAVPGGSVTTYEDVSPVLGEPHWFGFDYQGADAPSTGWIQFAAMEAELLDASDNSLGFETSLTTEVRGQPEKRIWSTPGETHWFLDAQSDRQPFYEAANSKTGASGSHDALPTKTAIWDLPGHDPKVNRAAFKAKRGAKVHKVVQRVRFHVYLVRGMGVLYENTMTAEFTAFGPADAPQRKSIAGTGTQADRIRPEHHAALVRRFPGWSFYRHDRRAAP